MNSTRQHLLANLDAYRKHRVLLTSLTVAFEHLAASAMKLLAVLLQTREKTPIARVWLEGMAKPADVRAACGLLLRGARRDCG